MPPSLYSDFQNSRPWIDHNLHRIRRHRLLHRRLDLTQSEAMSYKFMQRVLPHVARHLPHARSVRSRFFAAHAEYANVLGAQMPMRTDRNLSHIREIPRLDQKAAEAQHLQA